MPIDDEIPNDISALLRDARTEVPPAGAKDRVWAKTMAQIDGPAPAPSSSSTAASGAASAVRTAAVGGFAAGVLAGIAGTYTAVSMLVTPAVVYVEVPGPVTTVVALATPAPTATPKGKTMSTVVALLATPDSTAAERATERAWLDAARTALGRGDFESAMDALETARQRFPDGTLREEREAIGVHVLIARGDKTAARLAADTFAKRHKGSLFLPSIEDAILELEKGP